MTITPQRFPARPLRSDQRGCPSLLRPPRIRDGAPQSFSTPWTSRPTTCWSPSRAPSFRRIKSSTSTLTKRPSATYNAFPIPRLLLAQVIAKIASTKPAVIGVDVILDIKRDTSDDAKLAKAIDDAGNVILISEYGFGSHPRNDPSARLPESRRRRSLRRSPDRRRRRHPPHVSPRHHSRLQIALPSGRVWPISPPTNIFARAAKITFSSANTNSR